MKNFLSGLFLLAAVALSGCMGGAGAPNSSATAYTPGAPSGVSNVMRVGDKVTIRLTGTPDNGWIEEREIPTSGLVSLPLLNQPFQAAGRSSADLAQDITMAYKTQKIYSTPTVSVIPEERYVSVGGDVRGPSRVMYTPDLTLLSAINSCGGFTEYAQRKSVRIIRGQQTIIVNAITAASTPGADPPLYAGDQITVPRTMF